MKKKLSREDVIAIRLLSKLGDSNLVIARKFRVSPEHIALIVRGYRRANG